MDVIKIIAFDAAEPINDRVHHSYTLIFSVEKSNIRWTVTHQFSRFKILNLLIRKLAPKLIYSKFPKDGTTTLLGLRLSKKAVDNRRLMLGIWIREVVANFEIFPEEIAQSLNDFIKAPKKITTVLGKKFAGTAHSDDLTLNSAPLFSGGRRHFDMGSSNPLSLDTRNINKDGRNFSITSVKKRSKVEVLIRFIRGTSTRVLRNLLEKMFTLNGYEGTTTICLSRTAQLIMVGSADSGSGFISEIYMQFSLYAQFYLATLLLNQTAGYILYFSCGFLITPPGVIFLSSLAMYVNLLCRDYIRSDEEHSGHPTSCAIVQESLRKYLNAPTFEYSDKIYPFPTFLAYGDSGSPSSKSDSDDDSYSSSDDNQGIMSSEDTAFKHGLDDFIPKESSSPRAAMKKARPALHECLVPGSTYDNVEFTDMCPEAKAMYSDRSETHSMKVRGESYSTDNKKVNPGHAMSKLLLLELYEVEAKDGDRHDHIVARGAALRRLQALRTLPEKLFFVCVNFQIPGDPPVSIVSYFGLPMDLIERYPGSSTLKFLKTFERFIDIPRTEKERLEAWGVFSNEPATTTSSEASATESPVSPVIETNVQKSNTAVSTTAVPPAASKLPPLPPLIPPGLIAPTPAKKGRLSALLSRTGGRPSSSTTHTPTSRGNSLVLSGSPRSFKGNSNSALQDEPSCPTSEKKRRARSSSFNDAAAIAANDSGMKSSGSPDLAASFSRSESGNRRQADISLESPLVTARRSTSLLSSLSFDDGEASSLNGTRSRNKDSVILTCESSSSTVSRPEEVKSVVPSSPPIAVAAPSGGWRVPSDITWPTAHDKGALPPSDFRNERFKLIPSITIGPWIVKAAVGSTPALLGRKVVQRYFRGEDYLEIDIHVGSSVIASQVVGLCRGYAKNIVNDVGIVIQGEQDGELPERILAVGSLNRINVNIRQKLD